MTLVQIMMILIFLSTFVGLIFYQKKPETVFALATLACLLFTFVTTEEVLHNATNSGLITLILLVLCSFVLERTSLLRKISLLLFNGSVFKSASKILISTALFSALMSNTAVVATLISTIKNNHLINANKLLLPVSFAAILGGTLTLIGTSTNLIVNSMLIEQGHQGLAFFDFTFIGLAALIMCLLVILLRFQHLPASYQQNRSVENYLVEAKVMPHSALVDKSVEENGLRNLDALFLVEIIRNKRLISPVTPNEVIQADDTLIFSGDIAKVFIIQQFDGLRLFAEQKGLLRKNLTEVLVKPDAAIVGKTLKQAGFRARFDAAVVAIRREGEKLSGKLGEITLQAGDFLVLAVGNDFSSRTNLSKNFYILSGYQPENMLYGWRDKVTVIGFLAAIASSVVFNISLLTCLVFYLALLILTHCLNINEIKRRFPLEIWLIVLSALTLATALENTGVAQLIAENMQLLLQGHSAYIALIAIFILTLLITELITNNAAAALVFPLAYNLALALEVNPITFVMAVAFAASGSFISPYGYQTNVMVYNAGHYRLIDFIKFGVPVSLVYSITVLLMLPYVFPF